MRPHLRPLHRQRGAVAIFVAVAITALLISVLLAIEVGRIYLAHRHLQKMANLAALDAARVVSGCANPDNVTQSSLVDAVNTSLDRNGTRSSLTSVVVESGVVKAGAQTKRRYLQPTALWQARAARVTLNAPFPTALVPLLLPGQNSTMSASATAQQEAVGSFYLGSGLLSLSGGLLNDLLGALLCPLGTPGSSCRTQVVNLNLLDSTKGLASVNLSLGNLLGGATKIGLNVQDLSQLIDLQLTLPQWLGILGYGLEYAVNETGGQLGSGVSGLIRGLGGVADSSQTFSLAQILNVTGGLLNKPVSGLLGAIPIVNGQDLLLALGQAAKANASGSVQPIALPVQVSLGGLLNVYVFLQVLEPPKFALGRATGHPASWSGSAAYADCSDGDYTCAQTSQIRLLVRAGINDKILGLLKLRLGVDLNVAAAAAYLDALECPSSQVPHPTAHLSAVPSVAVVALGPYAGNPEDAKNAPKILNIPGNPQETKPYLLQLFPDQGLLGALQWLLGWALGDLKTTISLNAPVTGTVGDSSFRALSPVEEYDRTATAGKPTVYAAEGRTGAAAAHNPQTVGTTGVLHSLVGSLINSLACGDLSATCNLAQMPNISVQGPEWQKDSANVVTLLLIGLADLLNMAMPVVSGILDILNFLLQPLLSLLDLIVDGLLKLLGIQLGTAMVIMNSVTVDQPHLITTALPSDIPL
ncbi:pilus assembly protein TadG-related protein [Solimonas flava]|uniref:pilus assembly protein TadG-related protein n=1 Tax=Solimonas flava TaxID=415849 RepID=UPI00040DB9C4|nr:pilus assembly protein TadG-related protein [Solimonas flava]